MKIVNPTAVRGENIATQFLQKKGYKILERNFRKQYGEIDIVAIDTTKEQKILVFIEVKTRTSSQFGTPFEAITPWKLRSLIKTAQFYKLTHKNLLESLRIDGLSVQLSSDGTIETIEHAENISGF